jgi:flavin reductase (DIM6/NTAB) family NADH-FMN oxidoreductase RutF
LTKQVFSLDRAETRDAYKLLSGLIVPRPIGWIGTKRSDSSNNLAPFSFFNLVSSNPPVVLFSGGRHPDRPKDSVTLATETGEFTVNIVSEAVVEAMNLTSESFDADTDEFEVAGLTAIPGTKVDAPMVGESPANLECRVLEVVSLGAEGRTRVVFGEVLVIHVEDDLLDGTRIDSDALRAVGRMAGGSYTRTGDRFQVDRSI